MESPKINITKHPIIWIPPFVTFLALTGISVAAIMFFTHVEIAILIGLMFLIYLVILYAYTIHSVLWGILVYETYLVVYEKKHLFLHTPKKIPQGSIEEIKVWKNGFFANSFDYGTLRIFLVWCPPIELSYIPEVLENGKSIIAWNKSLL